MLRRKTHSQDRGVWNAISYYKDESCLFFCIPFPAISGPHQLNLFHGWPALPNSGTHNSQYPLHSIKLLIHVLVCLVCRSVCLAVSLSGSLSDCLSVCQSTCLSVCQSACLSICQSVCRSVCLSICLSVCLSVYLSVCLSARLSVCLSVCTKYVYMMKV